MVAIELAEARRKIDLDSLPAQQRVHGSAEKLRELLQLVHADAALALLDRDDSGPRHADGAGGGRLSDVRAFARNPQALSGFQPVTIVLEAVISSPHGPVGHE